MCVSDIYFMYPVYAHKSPNRHREVHVRFIVNVKMLNNIVGAWGPDSVG